MYQMLKKSRYIRHNNEREIEVVEANLVDFNDFATPLDKAREQSIS